jgi:WD40 repeat protein
MDRVARVWDPAVDDRARWTLPARQPLYDVAFSPDGSALAACGGDGEAALWTLDRPTPTALRLTGHDGPVFDVAFSPDGTTVATAGRDGTVHLWDRRTGLARVLLHKGALKRLSFSPDGTRIAVGNDLGTIRVWPVSDRELPETPGALAAWIRRQTSVVLDEDGSARSPIRQP